MEDEEKLRLMIVDDDETAIYSLKNTIQFNFPNIEIIGEANNVKDAIRKINELKPDLLILDIMLPDGYGFDILEAVEFKNFEVIITSSHPNYAIKAYEFSALHFLQKPVSLQSFKIAISRYKSYDSFHKLNERIQVARQVFNDSIENIMIPNSQGLSMLSLDDISCFEAESNYVTIHYTNGRSEIISRTLQKIESILENTHFYRTHNTFIINLKQIKSYHKGKSPYLILKNNKTIPVSLSRKDELIEKIKMIAKIV